jgi:hypothetical protein
MVVVRTLKHTTEEMVEQYLTGTASEREYVDHYLGANPGLSRKVSPIIKVQSAGTLKLRKAMTKEEAMEGLKLLALPEVDEAVEWLKELDEKLKKRSKK